MHTLSHTTVDWLHADFFARLIAVVSYFAIVRFIWKLCSMLNGTEGHPAHTREEILTIIINIFYSELLREGNSIDVNL